MSSTNTDASTCPLASVISVSPDSPPVPDATAILQASSSTHGPELASVISVSPDSPPVPDATAVLQASSSTHGPTCSGLRHEILPGLWVWLSPDVRVTTTPDLAGYELSVRASAVQLGDSSCCLLEGSRLALQAKVRHTDDSTVLENLNIFVKGLALDPLVDKDQIDKFLKEFGCGEGSSGASVENNGAPCAEHKAVHRSLPRARLSHDQWEQFLRNARDDVRSSDDGEAKDLSEDRTGEFSNMAFRSSESAPCSSLVDIEVPNVKVRALTCTASNDFTLKFPSCEGNKECTLRILLEYYFRSILRAMEERSDDGARIDMATTTSDLTSVGGSMVGAAAGATLLGPVGWVAGSYLGSKFGRKHSGSIAGAAAGSALFGPIGLVAGACYGESMRIMDDTQEKAKKVTIEPSSGGGSTKTARKAVSEHLSSHKYEYAGSTGVLLGASAGALALGPVGMVAGAYLGSVSGRKLVEGTSETT